MGGYRPVGEYTILYSGLVEKLHKILCRFTSHKLTNFAKMGSVPQLL